MTNPTEGQDGYAGQEGITSSTSRYNALRFLMFQALGEVSTIKVVQVMAVDDEAGTVDVKPLVKQMDGARETSEHGTIFGIPFAKMQAGKNALINPPKVKDIGVLACADRDISALKQAKGEANPGSFRRFHPSDGIYLMSLFGDEPDQRIEFTDDGIEIEDKNGNKIILDEDGVVIEDKNNNKLTLNAAGIEIDDKNGSTIQTTSSGIDINDASGNTLKMSGGFINLNGFTVDQLGNGVFPGSLMWNGGALGAGGNTIAGNFNVTGNITASVDVFSTSGNVSLRQHIHAVPVPSVPITASSGTSLPP